MLLGHSKGNLLPSYLNFSGLSLFTFDGSQIIYISLLRLYFIRHRIFSPCFGFEKQKHKTKENYFVGPVENFSFVFHSLFSRFLQKNIKFLQRTFSSSRGRSLIENLLVFFFILSSFSFKTLMLQFMLCFVFFFFLGLKCLEAKKRDRGSNHS